MVYKYTRIDAVSVDWTKDSQMTFINPVQPKYIDNFIYLRSGGEELY